MLKTTTAITFISRRSTGPEQLIKDGLLTLLERNDHSFEIPDVGEFLDNEAGILTKKISDFPKESFISERKRLIEGALKKSLYVISGKPGSGKTQALKKIIDEIRAKGGKRHLACAYWKSITPAKNCNE